MDELETIEKRIDALLDAMRVMQECGIEVPNEVIRKINELYKQKEDVKHDK